MEDYNEHVDCNRPIAIHMQDSKRAKALTHDWKEPVNPEFTGFAAEQLKGFPKPSVKPRIPNKM